MTTGKISVAQPGDGAPYQDKKREKKEEKKKQQKH